MNTMQQEFDAVVQHLYKQGRPAAVGRNCRYRTEEGLSCAVGCRIPDEAYSEGMEGKFVHDLADKYAEVLPLEIVEYADLFDDLQWAHDCWTDNNNPDYLEQRLKEVAAKYNLAYNDPRSVK